MTFRTDATIDQVGPGRGLQWRAADRQEQLQGSRLMAPTGPASCRFTEVVEGRLLGLSWPLGPLVLHRQSAADLRRLNHLLKAPATSGPTREGTATWPRSDGGCRRFAWDGP